MHNKLDPKQAPNAESKVNKVRRVNNLPLFLVIGMVAVFIIIIGFVALTKQQTADDSEPDAKLSDSAPLALELAGDTEGGIIGAESILTEPPMMPNNENASDPMTGLPMDAPQVDQDLDQIRQAKIQMFQQATSSKSLVTADYPDMQGSGASSGRSGVTSVSNDPDAISARLQSLKAQMQSNGSDAERQLAVQGHASKAGLVSNESLPTVSSDNPLLAQNSGTNFGNGSPDRWRLDTQVEAPASKYVIRTGAVIPAVMVGGINSQLAGSIKGQVTQNVYDTATGKKLLIPQGTSLIGVYSSDVAFGQNRVLIAWNRLVFPDGRALDIGSMAGVDGLGRSGFKDKVNNHYMRIFGSAIFLSAVTGGITYTTDRNSNNSSNDNSTGVGDALNEALGQQLGQVITQMVSKNLNIAPTIEIRSGFRFNVTVVKDLELNKVYQPYQY